VIGLHPARRIAKHPIMTTLNNLDFIVYNVNYKLGFKTLSKQRDESQGKDCRPCLVSQPGCDESDADIFWIFSIGEFYQVSHKGIQRL
jgi:hypothetical protein